MSDRPDLVTRRELLAAGLTVAGGALLVPSLVRQLSALQPPGAANARDVLIRNARAFDAEAPIAALADFRTAIAHHYVRSHFGPPARLPRTWTLTIDGGVQRAVTLTLDEIRRMPGAVTRPVTLECAGNGRGLFGLPKTSGIQWGYGAVSTATWTGVPLAAILERAGLRPDARHLWMEGLDRAPAGSVPKFLRSIPREVGLDGAFVAYAMNDGPIPLHNGGPLRLLVPGWYGMASTKWLTHVHAMPVESDNFYMKNGYRYADGRGVTALRPKSVVASPLEGARVRAGRVTMRGQAWSGSGSGGIRGVDVSADGGRTWRAARLLGTEQPGAWRSWEADVDVTAGDATLMARATDASGATQPMQPEVNPGGFANNVVHRVTIHVA
ncbi:sulfite oxidase [Roseisolibacter agri]|uniref:Sulfite oxidase n=1 Tax=Roseisolibacter agri TaxID=2014610 RepID=A0AA37QBX2_9BACT|nr:sulfite oxidase [Roseisolibacter agri]GLC26896.1 hypothetical protein rosag_34090 [Roseisolibacter agri]